MLQTTSGRRPFIGGTPEKRLLPMANRVVNTQLYFNFNLNIMTQREMSELQHGFQSLPVKNGSASDEERQNASHSCSCSSTDALQSVGDVCHSAVDRCHAPASSTHTTDSSHWLNPIRPLVCWLNGICWMSCMKASSTW